MAPRHGYMRAAEDLLRHVRECETCICYGSATTCQEGQRLMAEAHALSGEVAA